MNIGRHSRGFTFVELIAAIFVLAITLVPATQFLADSMTLRRDLERDRNMVLLAIQTIEEQMSVINGGWTTAQQTGTFASQGLPDLAYEIVRSDAAADGGISDLLMAIIVRVWSDDDGDQQLDAGETSVELQTKMARSVE